MTLPATWRKTTQDLAPVHHQPTPVGQYDLYPGFPLADGQIHTGFEGLTQALMGHRCVILDGYIGIFWGDLRHALDQALRGQGITARWYDAAQAMRDPATIDAMIAPYLGGDDPIFGKRYPGSLADWFDPEKLAALRPAEEGDLHILYGCGAALAGWEGLCVYVDLPKNELQFRSRAGSVTNLGATAAAPPKAMYKRYYFVDWPALNRHKADLLPRIDIMIDGQRPDQVVWMAGDALRAGLTRMSRNFFRVRPWFEPGAWGGQWIKRHIPQLPQDVVNYAWSFELIVPENGLLFQSGDVQLEVSFDLLMFQHSPEVIGPSAAFFGTEFPIRFDFLDTVEGGNLSLQCHPRPDFIRGEFGEIFTQDETYYILDCTEGAEVYLGFQEGIDPAAFRAALEESQARATPLDVDRFVQRHPAQRHDLFLIPNGTVHCSGEGCLVLEISATPYIFTFKMYDWLRLDLDGKPRPINIDRAFANLRFEMQGERVAQSLLSRPRVVEKGPDWQLIHLPTHPRHFYDIQRIEFDSVFHARIDGATGHSVHIMSLVEGRSVLLESADGMVQRFNYAETFVVPAAAGSYRLINEGGERLKIVRAFVKPSFEL